MEENHSMSKYEDRSFFKGGEQTEVNLDWKLEVILHCKYHHHLGLTSVNLKMKIKNKITLFCDSVPCKGYVQGVLCDEVENLLGALHWWDKHCQILPYICSRDCAAAVAQMQTKLVSIQHGSTWLCSELWRWYLHTIVTVVIFCTSMKPGILTPLRIYCRGGKGWLMLRITPEQSSSVENERNALLRTEAAAIEELCAWYWEVEDWVKTGGERISYWGDSRGSWCKWRDANIVSCIIGQYRSW